jgi:hypothetical protein
MQYYDLLDDLPPGQAQKLVISLFKQGAFGVRLRRPDAVQEAEGSILVKAQFERLSDTIEEELEAAHPELLSIWKELRSMVE